MNRIVTPGCPSTIERIGCQPNPPRLEYRLTEKGREVHPIRPVMAAWGDRWLTGTEALPLVLRHARTLNESPRSVSARRGTTEGSAQLEQAA